MKEVIINPNLKKKFHLDHWLGHHFDLLDSNLRIGLIDENLSPNYPRGGV